MSSGTARRSSGRRGRNRGWGRLVCERGPGCRRRRRQYGGCSIDDWCGRDGNMLLDTETSERMYALTKTNMSSSQSQQCHRATEILTSRHHNSSDASSNHSSLPISSSNVLAVKADVKNDGWKWGGRNTDFRASDWLLR